MRMRLVGVALGFLVTLAGVSAPSMPTYADGTCDTGCTTSTIPAPGPVTEATDATGGGSLAFTGADIVKMTAIGAGALVVGGVLVRRNRPRIHAAT